MRLHWLSIEGGGLVINLGTFSLLGIVTHVRSIWTFLGFLFSFLFFFPKPLPKKDS